MLKKVILQKTSIFHFHFFTSLEQNFDNIRRFPVYSSCSQRVSVSGETFLLKEITKTSYFPQLFLKLAKEIPLKENNLTSFQVCFPQ